MRTRQVTHRGVLASRDDTNHCLVILVEQQRRLVRKEHAPQAKSRQTIGTQTVVRCNQLSFKGRMRNACLSLAPGGNRERCIRPSYYRVIATSRCVSISPANSASAKTCGNNCSLESPTHPIIIRCRVLCIYPMSRPIMESHLDVHFVTFVAR